MSNLLLVLGILLVALVVILPLVERTAKPASPESLGRYHTVFRFLMGIMLLALVIRYFMGQ